MHKKSQNQLFGLTNELMRCGRIPLWCNVAQRRSPFFFLRVSGIGVHDHDDSFDLLLWTTTCGIPWTPRLLMPKCPRQRLSSMDKHALLAMLKWLSPSSQAYAIRATVDRLCRNSPDRKFHSSSIPVIPCLLLHSKI